jgi:hypothetical protein
MHTWSSARALGYPIAKEGTGEYMDDTVLTTNVKTAVFNAPLLKAAEINEDDLPATLPGLGSVGRPLFGRAAMTRQVPRRVDQAHVRECLGKIADQASRFGVVFFRQQSLSFFPPCTIVLRFQHVSHVCHRKRGRAAVSFV